MVQKWILLVCLLFLPTITLAGLQVPKSSFRTCNSQPYDRPGLSFTYTIYPGGNTPPATNPSGIADPYWNSNPFYYYSARDYPWAALMWDGVTYDVYCGYDTHPTLKIGYNPYLSTQGSTGSWNWNTCYYCGDTCSGWGTYTCPTGRYSTSLTMSQCKCAQCSNCPPGQYMENACITGYFAGGYLATVGADTVCDWDMCWGGTAYWCRNNLRTACVDANTKEKAQVFNNNQGSWGTIRVITPCSISYPPIFGWCKNCPPRMYIDSQCQAKVNEYAGTWNAYALANGGDPFNGGQGMIQGLAKNPWGDLDPFWTTTVRTVDVGSTTCTHTDLGSYVSNGQAIYCEPGYRCPDGINRFVCPMYQWSLGGGQICSNCEACPTGTYIETSPSLSDYAFNQPPCGKVASVQAYSRCKDCPVGSYCARMSNEYIQSLINGASSFIMGACTCPGSIGSYMLDIVNGCNSAAIGQYKPPICLPCPSGKDCTNPSAPVDCPIGTYGAKSGAGGGCIKCDTAPCPDGKYRPPGQCASPGLADPTGIKPWDRCLTCGNCDTATLGPLRKCGTSNGNLVTCGVVCIPGYFITIDPEDGTVICNPCSQGCVGVGMVPRDVGSCDGTKTTDIVCIAADLIEGQQQTWCSSYEGVETKMKTDNSQYQQTGDSMVFDFAGSVASASTHLMYDYKGWCIYAFPIGSIDTNRRTRLLGTFAVQGLSLTTECQDFRDAYKQQRGTGSNFVADPTVSSTWALRTANDASFIFGEMTSLIYDAKSDYMFFIATTYEFNNPPSNSLSTIINPHDEIIAMKMGPCLTQKSCGTYRVVGGDTWWNIYGGAYSPTKRLNHYGVKGRSLLDIAVVHYDMVQGATGNPTYITFAQEDKNIVVMRCNRDSGGINLQFPCQFLKVIKNVQVYNNLAGSVVGTPALYASIRTDQPSSVTGINNKCVLDRVNLATGDVIHAFVDVCDPLTQDFIVDLQVVPPYPNWLWITRKTGVWALDITDVDAFVTLLEIGNLTKLSSNSVVINKFMLMDTRPTRFNWNVTFPPNNAIVGMAIHMDTGFHWYPVCIKCSVDRYQPSDHRTHPYCRPAALGEIPTEDRQRVEGCRVLEETLVTMDNVRVDISAAVVQILNPSQNILYGLPTRLWCTYTVMCLGAFWQDQWAQTGLTFFFLKSMSVCMCKPGYYSTNPNGVKGCVPCPSGTYSTRTGGTWCDGCPATKPYSDPGSTKCTCLTSTFYNAITDSCESCPSGTTYNSSANSSDWKQVVQTGLTTYTLDTFNHKGDGIMKYYWPGPPVTTTEYSKNPYLSGSVCSCPVGTVFVMTRTLIQCLVCPVGFYCPLDRKAMNINPYVLHWYMRGVGIPIPYPLPQDTPYTSANMVSGTDPKYWAGGAVLCPGWDKLITNQASVGTGAKSYAECTCKPGAIKISGTCFGCRERGGYCKPGPTPTTLLKCINTANTFASTTTDFAPTYTACPCKPGFGWRVPTISTEAEDATFMSQGCIACATGYQAPSNGMGPCLPCAGSVLYYSGTICFNCPTTVIPTNPPRATALIAQFVNSTTSRYVNGVPGAISPPNPQCNCPLGSKTVLYNGVAAVCVLCSPFSYCPGISATSQMPAGTVIAPQETWKSQWRGEIACPMPYGTLTGTPYGKDNQYGMKDLSECFTCPFAMSKFTENGVTTCLYAWQFPCDSGYYRPSNAPANVVVCSQCPMSKYCPNGRIAMDCPVNMRTVGVGANSSSDCFAQCTPGYYRNQTNMKCVLCPASLTTYTMEASSVNNCTCLPASARCDLGYHPISHPGGVNCTSKCLPCLAGTKYCPGGDWPPTPCPGGNYTNNSYSPVGTSSSTMCTCPPGTLLPKCTPCPTGHICPLYSTNSTICLEDTYPGTFDRCVPCPANGTTFGAQGVYGAGGCMCRNPDTWWSQGWFSCQKCPSGSFVSRGVYSKGVYACQCLNGTYMSNGVPNTCKTCPAGFSCNTNRPISCAVGTWSEQGASECFAGSTCPGGSICRSGGDCFIPDWNLV